MGTEFKVWHQWSRLSSKQRFVCVCLQACLGLALGFCLRGLRAVGQENSKEALVPKKERLMGDKSRLLHSFD